MFFCFGVSDGLHAPGLYLGIHMVVFTIQVYIFTYLSPENIGIFQAGPKDNILRNFCWLCCAHFKNLSVGGYLWQSARGASQLMPVVGLDCKKQLCE